MTKHYTDADVEFAANSVAEAAEHAEANEEGHWVEGYSDDFARAILDAVAPAIAARALREEACPIVSDSRDQGLGMGAAQRAIWRRADEIEAGR
jgi:hypothetical protein